jgi:hypothetical protein
MATSHAAVGTNYHRQVGPHGGCLCDRGRESDMAKKARKKKARKKSGANHGKRPNS